MVQSQLYLFIFLLKMTTTKTYKIIIKGDDEQMRNADYRKEIKFLLEELTWQDNVSIEVREII